MGSVCSLIYIKVWDMDTGELVHNFNNHHEQPCHVLDCHPTEDNFVASAGYDARVYFVDVRKGECLKMFQVLNLLALLVQKWNRFVRAGA